MCADSKQSFVAGTEAVNLSGSLLWTDYVNDDC